MSRLGFELFLKHDPRQATGSFKERGARNKLMFLDGESKRRGLAASGRVCRLKYAICDPPGGLARLTVLIAPTGASTQKVAHDRNFASEDIASAVLDVVLETRNVSHMVELQQTLQASGVRVLR